MSCGVFSSLNQCTSRLMHTNKPKPKTAPHHLKARAMDDEQSQNNRRGSCTCHSEACPHACGAGADWA
eukprot:2859425-Amphidinium_carterae.1